MPKCFFIGYVIHLFFIHFTLFTDTLNTINSSLDRSSDEVYNKFELTH